ncbi:uncharacterized protein VTP21DRAFT_8088 [Calcarisporiella thermophila]|uniref:uncharacterized protein n=1 Tax=Calcarisporiella thermophila TaxID=911321 RepID=UPI003741FD74
MHEELDLKREHQANSMKLGTAKHCCHATPLVKDDNFLHIRVLFDWFDERLPFDWQHVGGDEDDQPFIEICGDQQSWIPLVNNSSLYGSDLSIDRESMSGHIILNASTRPSSELHFEGSLNLPNPALTRRRTGREIDTDADFVNPIHSTKQNVANPWRDITGKTHLQCPALRNRYVQNFL